MTKENWADFEILPADEFRALSPEDQKEYKRQRSKYNYYKGKGSDVKIPKVAKEEMGGTDLIDRSKREIEEKGIPMDLVNRFGRTACEVVMNEMNRGIGFTADEIFEMRDKRLKIYNEEEIQEIYDGLVAAGLQK